MNEWIKSNAIGMVMLVIIVLGGVYFVGQMNYHVEQIDRDIVRGFNQVNNELVSIKQSVKEINGKVQDHEIQLAVNEALKEASSK